MMEENGLPMGWVETTLGEVLTLQRGFDLPKIDRATGAYPLMASNGQDGTHNEYKVKGPGVITGRSGSLGSVFFVKLNFWPLNTTLWVKDFKGNSINFIYYFLKTFPFERYNSGSGVPTLNRNHIHPITVVIPSSLLEQKAIASILTSFDDKIELLQAQNETLETIAQTIFKEWFENKSESWEYRKIGDLLEVTSSKRIFHNEYVSSGIPFYRSKEIIELSTKPDITTELFISEERYKRIKEKFDVPQKGDILLTAVGTLGVPFQVRDNSEFYFKDGNLIWFKNFNDIASSDFVYYWLKLKSTQRNLNIISIGSTQKALTINSIQNMQIPILTDYESRIKFNSLLKSNLNKVNHNLTHIQTLQATRDTLLPKLMSGQLRVAEFQEQLSEVM